MSEIKRADYIGFSFNGIHSSELGIVRTSEGSRFNENLLPTIQDKTVQVPGGDGMYLFGSYYTQRQFNISYAFDALTEQQLARIKEVFGDKKIHELIFDELPYKKYYAKVTGSASIKHIPFGEGALNRIYKGEGSIQLTAYDPYAQSVYKYADAYQNLANFEEWRAAANLLDSKGDFDVLRGNSIKLYNPGVKESDFILTFRFEGGLIPPGKIYIGSDQLELTEMTSQNGDDSIKINTKLNLIEGYKNGAKSGNVYNRFMTGGTFFKIPVTTNTENPVELIISKERGLQECFVDIEYNYFYF